MRHSKGLIATSWNGKAEVGQTLCTLVFRANADGQLSELLGVSDRMVMAKALPPRWPVRGITKRGRISPWIHKIRHSGFESLVGQHTFCTPPM